MLNTSFLSYLNMSANHLANNTKQNNPINLSLEYLVVLVVLGVLAILIFAANAFVIYLFIKNRSLRIITNLCLVFLAVSDLLAALVGIPLTLVCNVLNIFWRDRFGTCIAQDLACRFIAINTILHLLIVSLERYLMIVYPLYYHRIVNKCRIATVLVLVWGVSVFLSLIQITWIMDDSGTSSADIAFSFSTFFGIVCTALGVMAAVFVHIFIVIRRQIKSIKKNNIVQCLTEDEPTASRRRPARGEGRAVIIFASMLVAFILGWFPYFVIGILEDLEVNVHVYLPLMYLTVVLRYGSSLANPLLYTFFKTDFKEALRKTGRKSSIRRTSRRTSQRETSQTVT